MRRKLLVLISALLIFPLVGAASLDIYYSPTCQHCQSYLKIISDYELQTYFSNWEWFFHDVTKESTNVEAVPTTFIKTNDGREITIEGNQPEHLFCELLEMSTVGCETYSADHSVGESWFRWQ